MPPPIQYDDTSPGSALLLRQLAENNEQAFTFIYNRYFTSLFYYVKRKVVDPDKANDLVAECFIKFWKSGKRDFDSLQGVHAYLLRSAANACINYNRDLKTELNRQKEFIYVAQQEEKQETEEEYKAVLMRKVLQEIEKLPTKCRRIFVMAYFDEMKNEEIAKKLDLSYRTVRNQKNRALTMLRIAFLSKKVLPAFIIFFIVTVAFITFLLPV